MSYLKKRRSAFGFAFSGLKAAFKTEPHLRIHAAAALAVAGAGIYFSISKMEWVVVLVCVTLVVSLELINSAIEKLCNVVMPEEHPGIKYVKDVAAGAVLLACIFSMIAGGMVFYKYLFG